MVTTKIPDNLRSDIDLLIRSDEWLDRERTSKAAEASRLLDEVQAIDRAKRLKMALQQHDMVVTQQIVHNNGVVTDIIFQIQPMANIRCQDNQQNNQLNTLNREVQKNVWRSDGYDVS